MLQINQRLLGDAGLELSEEDYVRAVAWAWSQGLVEPRSEFARREQVLQSSELLRNWAKSWIADGSENRERTIRVPGWIDESSSVDIVRVLNHPAVGFDSVVIDWPWGRADVKWQWPLRISQLQGDSESIDLSPLWSLSPSGDLTELHTLNREQGRCEILIIQGTPRDALRRVLESQFRIRAGYVVLIGPLDTDMRQIGTHVDAIIEETQAFAFSIVSTPPAEVATQLNQLVNALSQNAKFDSATANAFPRTQSLTIVNSRAVERADLTAFAAQLGDRLLDLPKESRFELKLETMGQIELEQVDQRSAAAVGKALLEHHDSISFRQESQGAGALREIADAERETRASAVQSDSERRLQGNLSRLSDGGWVTEELGLVVGQAYRYEVFIGPSGMGATELDRPFPEEAIEWRRAESHTLQVLFTEPYQWDSPFQGTLELPRGFNRSSTKCRFDFRPTRVGPFMGRIVVYYRGRILQTALLSTVVVETKSELASEAADIPLGPKAEAQIRNSWVMLDDAPRFDACIILNHASSGTPTMTAAGAEGAYITSLEGVSAQIEALNSILSNVAYNSKAHRGSLGKKENAKLLCDLATEGTFLYRNLVQDYLYQSAAAEALKKAEYLQIVSAKPDAIVPLEFVYDYPPPVDDAPVCKNAKKALQQGYCPAECHPDPRKESAPCVCPLGFWGLSRVIERHVHDPDLLKAAGVTVDSPIEPIPGRNVLSLNGACLFASSKEVPTSNQTKLKKYLSANWTGSDQVKTWDDWRNFVQSSKPVILLALPHAEGSGSTISLEISGDVKGSRFINRDYVLASPDAPPIVLLLGCDTSNVAEREAYARHIATFRRADAPLVLGTVATVVGADAAKLAEKLAIELQKIGSTSSVRFGELLRRIKRDAVAGGNMVALCVVAFGDADWVLKR